MSDRLLSLPEVERKVSLDRRRELAQEWADLLLEGAAPLDAIVEGKRR